MTRILAIALTLGLATILVTQTSPNAEAAKEKPPKQMYQQIMQQLTQGQGQGARAKGPKRARKAPSASGGAK
jgi:hypothetical protein